MEQTHMATTGLAVILAAPSNKQICVAMFVFFLCAVNTISELQVQRVVPIRNPSSPSSQVQIMSLHNCFISAALFNHFKVLLFKNLLH